jgi:hypothetical protein
VFFFEFAEDLRANETEWTKRGGSLFEEAEFGEKIPGLAGVVAECSRDLLATVMS